ncbi:uncharacterized protein LOC136076317 [Hydra vulgaris]|uniref:Uncharacterized protein LOC136076317 n=1 Tax=Hydra vulgaris TaxID=6087 RepID=A0ABM4BAE5_HYDVU
MILNSYNIIQTTRAVATTLYICPNCTKPYRKISYYEKHVETCKGACLYAQKDYYLMFSFKILLFQKKNLHLIIKAIYKKYLQLIQTFQIFTFIHLNNYLKKILVYNSYNKVNIIIFFCFNNLGPALSDSSQERLKNIFSNLFWIVTDLTSKDLILNLSFGLLKSPGNITALLASKISTERELYGSCFNDFIGYLLLKMLPILNLYSSTAVSQEKICKLLNSLCICEELNKKIYSALKYFHINTNDQLNLQPAYMLKNVVITKEYEKSLIWRNTELFPCQKEQPLQLELTLNRKYFMLGDSFFSL